jgi:hypothetical protein
LTPNTINNAPLQSAFWPKKAADPAVAAFHEALARKYTAFAETLDMGEANRWQGFVQNECR